MNVVKAPNATAFSIAGGVMSRAVGDETVLLNLRTGLYFSFNATGTLLWSALLKGASLEALAETLTCAFSVSAERATADARAFTADLVTAGLLIERRDETAA